MNYVDIKNYNLKMEFINFIIETDWSRTRLPGMFYLSGLTASTVSTGSCIFRAVGRKSKELYLQLYGLAAYLIFFQNIALFVVENSYFRELTTVLAFVYVTAILILFLIFLALITSEVFYEKEYKSQVVKISEMSISTFVLIWIITLNFICFIYTVKDMSYLIKAKMLIMEWLNQHDNKNIRRVDYKAEALKKYSPEFWRDIGHPDFKDYKTPVIEKKKYNIKTDGIFYFLKKEVIDEYITYSASALLQGLCLILVIILLI